MLASVKVFVTVLVACLLISSVVAQDEPMGTTSAPSETIAPHQYRWMNCLDIQSPSSDLYPTMSTLAVANGIVYVGGGGALRAYLRALDLRTGNITGSLNFSVPVPDRVTTTDISVIGAVDPKSDVFITYVLTPYTITAFSGPSFRYKWSTTRFPGSNISEVSVTGRFLCMIEGSALVCYRTEDGSVELNMGGWYDATFLTSGEMILIPEGYVEAINITTGLTSWGIECNSSYSCNGPRAVADSMVFYDRDVLSIASGELAWTLDKYTSFAGRLTFSSGAHTVILLNSTGGWPRTLVAYATHTGQHLWSTKLVSPLVYNSIPFLTTDGVNSFIYGGTIQDGFQFLTGDVKTGAISGWKAIIAPITLAGLYAGQNGIAVAAGTNILQQYCLMGL
jgi:hypothetical protein